MAPKKLGESAGNRVLQIAAYGDPVELSETSADGQESAAAQQLRAQARQLAQFLRAKRRELRRLAEVGTGDDEVGPQRGQHELEQLQHELETERAELVDVRQRWERELSAEREKWAAEQRQQQQQLLERAELVRTGEERLEEEKLVLHHERVELAGQRQQLVELQLACELRWSELLGRQTEPELIRSVGQLRAELASVHDESLRATRQQRELAERLLTELDQRQRQLRKQREDWQTWVLRRHEELEVQAAQLVAQQQELQRTARQLSDAREASQQEIRGYQRQIRQLSAQLRCKTELSRVA